jgi:hypothetical protein
MSLRIKILLTVGVCLAAIFVYLSMESAKQSRREHDKRAAIRALDENGAPPAAVVEAPPPPEPASPLGSATGTLRMVDFAKDADFWAYDKDASDANLAKAQGRFSAQFHSAMAQWKPRSQTLVIFLFADNLNEGETAELKTSILNNGDAIHKRNLTLGKVAFITVRFETSPPATGAQTEHVTLESKESNGRPYTATGPADVQVSSLPVKQAWAKPGRVLPEIVLRTSGKTHYGGSSFGSSEWEIETRVPMIITSGY